MTCHSNLISIINHLKIKENRFYLKFWIFTCFSFLIFLFHSPIYFILILLWLKVFIHHLSHIIAKKPIISNFKNILSVKISTIMIILNSRKIITKINIILIIIKYRKENLIETASLEQMDGIMSSCICRLVLLIIRIWQELTNFCSCFLWNLIHRIDSNYISSNLVWKEFCCESVT